MRVGRHVRSVTLIDAFEQLRETYATTPWYKFREDGSWPPVSRRCMLRYLLHWTVAPSS